MGVLDSSYIKALGVKSAGLKKIFLVFQDTLLLVEHMSSVKLVYCKWWILVNFHAFVDVDVKAVD